MHMVFATVMAAGGNAFSSILTAMESFLLLLSFLQFALLLSETGFRPERLRLLADLVSGLCM